MARPKQARPQHGFVKVKCLFDHRNRNKRGRAERDNQGESCARRTRPSTAPTDISDHSINGGVFEVRFEHGVWKQRDIGRCRLMMWWKRCTPGEAGIWRQRRWHGWIRGDHQALFSKTMHATACILAEPPARTSMTVVIISFRILRSIPSK